MRPQVAHRLRGPASCGPRSWPTGEMPTSWPLDVHRPSFGARACGQQLPPSAPSVWGSAANKCRPDQARSTTVTGFFEHLRPATTHTPGTQQRLPPESPNAGTGAGTHTPSVRGKPLWCPDRASRRQIACFIMWRFRSLSTWSPCVSAPTLEITSGSASSARWAAAAGLPSAGGRIAPHAKSGARRCNAGGGHLQRAIRLHPMRRAHHPFRSGAARKHRRAQLQLLRHGHTCGQRRGSARGRGTPSAGRLLPLHTDAAACPRTRLVCRALREPALSAGRHQEGQQWPGDVQRAVQLRGHAPVQGGGPGLCCDQRQQGGGGGGAGRRVVAAHPAAHGRRRRGCAGGGRRAGRQAGGRARRRGCRAGHSMHDTSRTRQTWLSAHADGGPLHCRWASSRRWGPCKSSCPAT